MPILNGGQDVFSMNIASIDVRDIGRLKFCRIVYEVLIMDKDICSLSNCWNKTLSERAVKYSTYWFCDGVREFFKIQFGMASGPMTWIYRCWKAVFPVHLM